MRQFLAAVAMVGLVACGGGGSGGAPVDERARLEESVRSYSAAYLGGRPESAYALLSARCRDRLSLAELTAATTAAQRLYGGARMTALEVETLEGSLARVTYHYDNPALDQQAEPWTKEDGQWRQDDC